MAHRRRGYEVVWGRELDPRNVHREVTRAQRFVEPVDGGAVTGPGGPAQLSRRGQAVMLHPPSLRRA